MYERKDTVKLNKIMALKHDPESRYSALGFYPFSSILNIIESFGDWISFCLQMKMWQNNYSVVSVRKSRYLSVEVNELRRSISDVSSSVVDSSSFSPENGGRSSFWNSCVPLGTLARWMQSTNQGIQNVIHHLDKDLFAPVRDYIWGVRTERRMGYEFHNRHNKWM
jgi:hypothetical protein